MHESQNIVRLFSPSSLGIKSVKYIKQLLVNLVIYILSFHLVYFIKRNEIILSEIYLKYFIVFISGWALSSLLSGKFIREREKKFGTLSRNYITSFFVFLGLLTLATQYFNMFLLSRSIILGALLLSFFSELVYIRIVFGNKFQKSSFYQIKVSLTAFLREIFILTVSVSIVIFMKFSDILFSEINVLLLTGVYFSWVISAIYAGHLSPLSVSTNKVRHLWGYVKSYIVFLP